MKMTKILLTAALLISARAFAMDQAVEAVADAAAPVKATLVARARQAASQLWTNGIAKLSNGAKTVWGKVPGMPESAKAKLATCYNWTTGKGVAASNWVVNHTPAAVKTALTSKRNLKIAGAAAVLATAATCWHFFGNKLMSKKTAN